MPRAPRHRLRPVAGIAGDPDRRQQALDWTRHTLNWAAMNEAQTGLLTVRTVDIDLSRPPMSELSRFLRHNDNRRQLQLVLEDLALPFYAVLGFILPFPVHGRVGLRRNRDTTTDAMALGEYDLAGDPVRIDLGTIKSSLASLKLQAPAMPEDQFIFFDLAVYATDSTGRPDDTAVTIGLGDDWAVEIGFRNPGTLPRGWPTGPEPRPPANRVAS